MRLVTVDHVDFNQAKRQAREELMGNFGFTGSFGEAEDMNIFGDNNDAAALLAMSVIAQGNLNESSFTERITHISSDIADGTVDNDNLWREMAIWAMSADLSAIRQNMENWGEHVPEFEKYIRQFWRSTLDLTSCSNIDGFSEVEGTILICRADGWDRANPDEILNYYLGKCDSSNQDEVKRCEGESENCAGKMMVCHDKGWEYASQDDIINSIGIKNFGQCREDKQGEIASCNGKEVCCPSEEFCFDGTTLICRDGRWRAAQYEEILSYYLGTCDSGNVGEIKQCEADYCAGQFMICRDKGWEYADYWSDEVRYYIANTILGACTPEKLGEIGKCIGEDNKCCVNDYCMDQFMICRDTGWEYADYGSDEVRNYFENAILGACTSEKLGEIARCEEHCCVEDYCLENNIMICRADGWGNAADKELYSYYLGTPCDSSNIGELKLCEKGKCNNSIMVCRADGWDEAIEKERLDFYLGACNHDIENEYRMCKGDQCGTSIGLMICRADGWDYAADKEILTYYLGSCDASNSGELKRCDDGVCKGNIMVCRDDGWKYGNTKDQQNYWNNIWLGKCDESAEGTIKICETGGCVNTIMVCRADGWDNANTKEKLSYYLGTCATDNVGELKMCEADYCKDRIMVCRVDGWDNANTKEILSYYVGTCDSDNLNAMLECTGACAQKVHCTNQFAICREDGWGCSTNSELLNYYLGKPCNSDNVGEFKKCETGTCANYTMICRATGWDYATYIEKLNHYLGKCDSDNAGDIISYDPDFELCTDEMWNCSYMICTETGWEDCAGYKYYDTCRELLLGTCDVVGEYKCITNWGLFVCKHSGWKEIDVEEQAYWNYFLGECKAEIYEEIHCIESNMFGCAICSKDGNWYEVGQPDVLYYELGECYYNGEVKFCENGSCPLISTHYNYTSNYFKCDCRNPLDDSIYYHTSCDYIQTYEEADILINKLGRCDHDGAVTKCEDEYCEGKYYVCYYEGEDWPLFYWYETTQEYDILKYILGECNQDGKIVQCEDDYCYGKNYRCTLDFDEYYWQEIND